MIRYSLRCRRGHEFEAWFRSSDAYDEQEVRGFLSCASCGSAEVEKALMAPAVPASTRAKGQSNDRPAAGATKSFGASLPAELIDVIRRVRKHVSETSDYVGDRFAEEARRIHYEESEQRGIHGEATMEQARQLHKEGIEVHPLPKLPEDAN